MALHLNARRTKMRIRHRLILLAVGAILLGWASSPSSVGALPAVRAQQPGLASRQPVTVIMQCDYHSAGPSTAFRTEVQGIEVSSGNDLGLVIGGRCSDAAARLALLGFEIVNSSSAVADHNTDGDVDGRDFLMWRRAS
jgi:hypothetical protein